MRWGTELHDRFLLPHFVRQDFADVICDLRRAGYPFEMAWFEPFFEFRFPHYGDLVTDNGIDLELRAAIEPWHVLGEEVTAQGTARFVDCCGGAHAGHGERPGGRPPRDRLQRPAGAAAPHRRKRPSSSPGCASRPGARPRACTPPSPAHNPLIFEIVDTWNRHSLGGCTYYVAHPGGRSESSFPVNATRRSPGASPASASWATRPGPSTRPPDEPAGEHPYTLDLRYRPGC